QVLDGTGNGDWVAAVVDRPRELLRGRRAERAERERLVVRHLDLQVDHFQARGHHVPLRGQRLEERVPFLHQLPRGHRELVLEILYEPGVRIVPYGGRAEGAEIEAAVLKKLILEIDGRRETDLLERIPEEKD